MSKSRYVLQVHVGAFSNLYEALSIEASKQTTASDIVACIAEKLGLTLPRDLELAEVVHNASGEVGLPLLLFLLALGATAERSLYRL